MMYVCACVALSLCVRVCVRMRVLGEQPVPDTNTPPPNLLGPVGGGSLGGPGGSRAGLPGTPTKHTSK